MRKTNQTPLQKKKKLSPLRKILKRNFAKNVGNNNKQTFFYNKKLFRKNKTFFFFKKKSICFEIKKQSPLEKTNLIQKNPLRKKKTFSKKAL